MDAGLSFIMANHAKVNENDLVFDPFVGTGEIIRAPTLTHIHSYSRGSHKLKGLCLLICFREPLGSMFSF